MRALLLILILVVVAALAAIATGYININQIRPAQVPVITTTREGVAAKGGQTPAFRVETGQVAIGSREATIKVPAIEVRPAGSGAAAANPAPAQAQPAPQVRPGPAPRQQQRVPAAANDGSVTTNATER